MKESLLDSFHVQHQPGIDLRIYDPAFSAAYTIEAEGQGSRVSGVLYDILNSPAGLRSLGINQLSKSPLEETYEGSADFKRWQHVAGVFRLVKYFGRQQNLDADTIIQYALIAGLPDLGHGVKSHATDMMIEGMGGEESFHDQRVSQTIELGGIKEILDKHGIANPFDSSGKVRVEVPPWVECKAPGLNVDRLHYINAELALMFPDNSEIREASNLSHIAITEDGNFAFTDIEPARVWAKGALLCSSEHWNHPVNRLILLKSVESLKRTIFRRHLHGVEDLDNGYVGRPQDYTFLIDNNFDEALRKEASARRPDIFMNETYSILQSLGHHERERFEHQKKAVYEEYLLDALASEYPNELVNPHRASFGVLPPMVEVVDSSKNQESIEGVQEEVQGRGAIYMIDGVPVGILKRLKKRQFDPLVKTSRGAVPLSTLDPNFERALLENGQALEYVGAIALHIAPTARDALIEAVRENGEMMEESADLPDLSPDQVRKIFRNAGREALRLAINEGRWQEITR